MSVVGNMRATCHEGEPQIQGGGGMKEVLITPYIVSLG